MIPFKKDDFKTFTLYTGVEVEAHSDYTRLGLDLDTVEKIRTGRRATWYDSKKNTIYVFLSKLDQRNPERTGSRIQEEVLVQAAYLFGVIGMFREKARDIFLERNREAFEKGELSFLLTEDSPFKVSFMLRNLIERDPTSIEVLSSALKRATGLTCGPHFNDHLCSAIKGFVRKQEGRIGKDGRIDDLSFYIEESLSGNQGQSILNLGKLTDAYRVLGYPDAMLSMKGAMLKEFVEQNGLLSAGIGEKLVEAVKRPLAVFGEYTGKYKVVLDLQVKNGLFAFNLDNPRKVARDFYHNEKHSCVFCFAPFVASDEMLLRQIKRKDNVRLMRSVENGGYKDFELLGRLEKKIGDLASPPLSNGSGQNPLNLYVANIRNNFKNPKIIRDSLKEIAFEEAEMMKMMDSSRKKDEYVLSTEEKKRVFFPKSIVSKSVYEKLEKLDIRTVGDVMARGQKEMEALTNAATVSKLDAFMRTMGLSLFPRAREESESVFSHRTDDEKASVILSNLLYNFSRVPQGTSSIPVPFICGLDGSFVAPKAQWVLASKYVSMGKRWEDCPVFDTFENLIGNGILPLATASVTHVEMKDGTFRSLYCLKETTLYANNRESYDAYLDVLRGKVPDMGPIKGMLSFYRDSDREKAATSLIVANENCRTPEGKAPSFVESVSEKVRTSLKKSVSNVDFSMGRAGKPEGETGEEIILAARAALFMAQSLCDAGINTIVVFQEEAKRIRDKAVGETTQEYRRPDDVVYGYNIGNDIYLTPEGINPNTPIHEYTHLWAKAYRALHPEGWESLKAELKDLPVWETLKRSGEYAFLAGDEDRLAGEVLAKTVGEKGGDLLAEAARSVATESGRDTPAQTEATVEKFREILTRTALDEVFCAKEIKETSKVSLQVLQDFAAARIPSIDTKNTIPEFNMNTPTSLFTKEEMERTIGLEYMGYAEKYNRAAASDPEAGHLAGYPQNYNGGCYQGPAALALELKMLADDLKIPVFVTVEQMEELGIRRNPGAEGVSVFHKDVIPNSTIRTKIYALEQTTFSIEYPEYFEQLKDYFQNKGYSIVGTYKEDIKKNIPPCVYNFCVGWNISTQDMSDMERLMKATLIGVPNFKGFMLDIKNMTPSDMFRRVNEDGLFMFTKQKIVGAIVQKGVNVDDLNSRISKVLKAQQERSQEQSESATRSRGIK
ncbi:MAG: hypothetical protein IJ616_06320 [Bacteroidales bacterium]|nr:hypothetical protein [Bacteroidales bacterium]